MSKFVAVYDRYGSTQIEECDTLEEAKSFLKGGADHGLAVFDVEKDKLTIMAPFGIENKEALMAKIKKLLTAPE